MDAENGTAKLHQGAGVASQPSPCPSPLPVSSSAAASPTPTISSSMPASATTAATSSESVEAEAGHIYQPGTKAEVRLVYRIKKGPGAGRHQKSFSISRYGVQGAWEQAEAARQYINAHGTLPPHFVVQSLPSKANGSSSSNQKGRRGPASAAASTATAGYTSSSSSGASSGAGVGAAVNSHSSGQGDGAGRQRGAGGGASGGGRSVGRGGSSSKGGGDGTEKKGRLNASQADVGSGFLNCGTGARGGGRGRAAASRAAPLVGFPSPTSSGASAHNVYLNLQGRGILPAGLRGMVHPYVFLASGGAGTTPVTAGAGAASAARAPRVSGAGDEAQHLGAQPNPFIGILPNVLNSAVVAQGGGGVVKGLPLSGAQSAIPSPAGTIPSSCPTAAGVKTAPSVSSALPSVSVTPSVGPPGGTAAPAPSSAAAPVSTIVTQHTPGDPNSNKAAPQAVTAVGRESEMLQAGLTEGGCIRLFLPFSALSRTVVMPPGGTTAATIIVPETKILVQPGTVGTVVIATNPSGAAAGGVCGMSVGGESGGSPTCTSSTTAGGGSNVDDECHASSEASSSTSTSPVSSRGVGTVVVGGDRGSTTEQTSGLHTGATASEATGEGGQPTPGGSRPTSSAAASSSGTGGEAAEDGTSSVCGTQEKDINQESGVSEEPESKSVGGDNDLKRPLPSEETSTFSRPAGRDTLWLFSLVDGCDSAAVGTETSGGNGTASTAVLGRDGTSKGDAASSDQGAAPWVVESSTLLSAAAGLAEVTFLSSPVPSPPGSPPSMCRSGFAEASPGSGAGRVRPFKRRCLDVSPLFLCSGSPPTGGTGDTSSSSASSTHAEHGNSLCPRTSSLDTRNGAASTGSSLTFLLSSPPSSEYSRGPFAGFASPLPSGSKSGASAAVTFPALPPPLASFRSPDIAVQQLSRRSQEASRSESRESSCGNEKTSKKAGAGVKGERSETPVGDKKEKEDGQVSCKGQETGSGATSALASLSSPVSEMFSSPSLPASGKPQERGAVRLKNQYDIGGSLSASSSSVSASPSLAPSSISPFFAFSPFSVLPRPSPPCGPSSFPGVGGPASPKSGSACNNRRLVLLPGERSSFSASPLDDQSTPQLFTNSNPPVFSEALSTSPGLFALSSPSVASSGLLEPPHASPSRGPSPVGQSNECASGASLVPQPGDTALNSVSDSCLKPGLDLHDTTDSGSGDALGDEDGKPEGAPVSGPSPLLLSAGVGQLPPDDGCATAQLGPSVIGGGHEQDTPPQAAVTSSVQPEPGGGGGSSPSASSEKPSGFLGLDGSSRVQSVLASLVAEGGLLGASISGKIGDKTSSTGGEPQQQKQEDRLFAGNGKLHTWS